MPSPYSSEIKRIKDQIKVNPRDAGLRDELAELQRMEKWEANNLIDYTKPHREDFHATER